MPPTLPVDLGTADRRGISRTHGARWSSIGHDPTLDQPLGYMASDGDPTHLSSDGAGRLKSRTGIENPSLAPELSVRRSSR